MTCFLQALWPKHLPPKHHHNCHLNDNKLLLEHAITVLGKSSITFNLRLLKTEVFIRREQLKQKIDGNKKRKEML